MSKTLALIKSRGGAIQPSQEGVFCNTPAKADAIQIPAKTANSAIQPGNDSAIVHDDVLHQTFFFVDFVLQPDGGTVAKTFRMKKRIANSIAEIADKRGVSQVAVIEQAVMVLQYMLEGGADLNN